MRSLRSGVASLKSGLGVLLYHLKPVSAAHTAGRPRDPDHLESTIPGPEYSTSCESVNASDEIHPEQTPLHATLAPGRPAGAVGNGSKPNDTTQEASIEDTRTVSDDSRDNNVNVSHPGSPKEKGQKLSMSSPTPVESDGVRLYDDLYMHTTPPTTPNKDLHLSPPRFRARQGALAEKISKLGDSCMMVIGSQVRLDEARNKLRRERQVVNDLDALLIQRLRAILSQSLNPELQALSNLWEDMDAARNELNPKEDDYSRLEDKLVSEEYDLSETAKDLLPGLVGARDSLLEDNDLASLLDESETALGRVRGSGSKAGSESNTVRPELREYLSRVGDRDVISDSLSELRYERAKLVEEERIKARFDLRLDDESREYLSNFNIRHEELQGKLARVNQDIGRLNQILSYDEMPFFTTLPFVGPDGQIDSTELRDADPDQLLDPHESQDARSSTIDAPLPANAEEFRIPRRDTLLVYDTGTEAVSQQLMRPQQDSVTVLRHINAWLLNGKGSISPAEFINNWLLSLLRSSSLEVRYYRQYLDSTKIVENLNISEEELRDLVVYWWFEDGAAKDFLRTLEIEARGLSLSARSQPITQKAQSDTALRTINQLADRLHLDGVMLQRQEASDTVRFITRRAMSI